MQSCNTIALFMTWNVDRIIKVYFNYSIKIED